MAKVVVDFRNFVNEIKYFTAWDVYIREWAKIVYKLAECTVTAALLKVMLIYSYFVIRVTLLF
jgi:hypothetical protein